jgi:hypothetical protein
VVERCAEAVTRAQRRLYKRLTAPFSEDQKKKLETLKNVRQGIHGITEQKYVDGIRRDPTLFARVFDLTNPSCDNISLPVLI